MAEKAITKGLENLKVECDLGYAPKIAAGRAGQPTSVRTNSIELGIKPNTPIYKYDVRMNEVYSKEGIIKEKELCKQTRDDYTEQDRKQKTVALFKHLADGKKLPALVDMVYDRAAIMFSTKKIDQTEIKLKPDELKKIKYTVGQDLVEIRIVVKPVTEDYQLTSNDIGKGEKSPEILEFLNLLTSQVAFFTSGSFIVYGNNNVFLYDSSTCGFSQRDLPELGEGKYMGVGCSKSVKLLEGSSGKSVPVITLDVVKTAFHADFQPAHEKAAALLQCNVKDLARCMADQSTKKVVSQGIKGLAFQTTYLGEKIVVFPARGLGNAASQVKFAIDGKEITVTDYFAKKYKITLKYPQLPVIISSKGSFFPMEMCVVAPNQRVTFNQQTPDQMKTQIRACAVPPSTRLHQTDQVSKAVSMAPGSTNANFKATGVTIAEKPITVAARVLPLPTIRDKRNTPAIMGNCRWTDEGFIVPAAIKNWAVYSVLNQQDAHKENMIDGLINALVNIGKQNGMTFEAHKYKKVDQYQIEQAFVDAQKGGVRFILFVQSDALKHHDAIKALEQKYQILTQDLKFSKCFETGKRDTMKNIMQKMNMKNGGLNHHVIDVNKQLDQRVLVLGIEFTHPPPCLPGKEPSAPSVLGFASNCTAQSQVFVGDYKYIRARSSDDQSEIAIHLKQVYEEAIQRFKANRTAPPGLVIIYRNGASEGQYPILINEEIPLFYQTCDKISDGKYKPELVMIAVNKDHVHRLYKPQPGNGRPAEQNIMPGTVVDKGIVSAARNEFFLSSHSAFQGTAKTPKYTVIKNGTTKNDVLNMDTIEQMTHALTFGHGIVSMTISVPVVLKVAGECAKRGANNYKVHYGDSSSSGSGPANLQDANEVLTYSKKPLSQLRYNS